jgi:hypothetical protein
MRIAVTTSLLILGVSGTAAAQTAPNPGIPSASQSAAQSALVQGSLPPAPTADPAYSPAASSASAEPKSADAGDGSTTGKKNKKH